MPAIERQSIARNAKMGMLEQYLELIARNYEPLDIVLALGAALSDQGYRLAEKTGDYSRATEFLIAARYLERLANYEPAGE